MLWTWMPLDVLDSDVLGPTWLPYWRFSWGFRKAYSGGSIVWNTAAVNACIMPIKTGSYQEGFRLNSSLNILEIGGPIHHLWMTNHDSILSSNTVLLHVLTFSYMNFILYKAYNIVVSFIKTAKKMYSLFNNGPICKFGMILGQDNVKLMINLFIFNTVIRLYCRGYNRLFYFGFHSSFSMASKSWVRCIILPEIQD